MGLDARLLGIGPDECQCGRRKSIPHCVHCGSYRLYGYAMPVKVLVDGELQDVTQYRCMQCSRRHTENEREHCPAPYAKQSAGIARQQAIALSSAVRDNHPLTETEVVVKKAMDEMDSRVEALPIDAPLVVLSSEGERQYRIEWAHAKLKGETALTVDEFLLQIRKYKTTVAK